MLRIISPGRLALIALINIMSFGPAAASSEAPETPEKISVLVTFGDDICPEPENENEIVVCAQRPESERYRIPKELRTAEDERAIDHSWASTVALHDEAARPGRPNSCSVVGTNGFTGCPSAFIRRWFEERRELED